MKIKFSHIDYTLEGKDIVCRVAVDRHLLMNLVDYAATSLNPIGVPKSQKLIEDVNVFLNTFYEGRARLKCGDKNNEELAKKIAYRKAIRRAYKRARDILTRIYSHNAKIMDYLDEYINADLSNKIEESTTAIKVLTSSEDEGLNIRQYLKHGRFGLLESGSWFRVFNFNGCLIIVYENGQWDRVEDYLPDGTQDDYGGENITLIYSYASDYDDARDRIKRIFKTGLINQDEFLWTRFPNEFYYDYFLENKEKEQKLTF